MTNNLWVICLSYRSGLIWVARFGSEYVNLPECTPNPAQAIKHGRDDDDDLDDPAHNGCDGPLLYMCTPR